MKSLRSCLGAIAIMTLGFGQAARAVPLQYIFDVSFTQGPLLGQASRGTLAVDCTAPCNGTFTPTAAGARLLSFDIAVGGISFSMTDDVNLFTGLYPYVTVVNGAVSEFDFNGLKNLGDSARRLNLGYAFGGGSAIYFDPGFTSIDPSFGSIGSVTLVPELGTSALLAVGLACLGLNRIRRSQRDPRSAAASSCWTNGRRSLAMRSSVGFQAADRAKG